MTRRFSHHGLGGRRASRRVLIACALAVTAAAGWALLGARPTPRSYLSRLADLGAPPERAGESGPGAVPQSELLAAATAATLWDELFPAPPPPAVEPPPPTLAVELVAIIGAADRRRAFLFDKATQTYQDLGVGESLAKAGGTAARLTAVGERHALFDLAGREVRVELTP